MCGIFGIIDQQNRPVETSLIQAACDRIAHRGPDGQGIYQGPFWAFGHRRLAVIDLSDKGRQPMKYRNQVLTYNGEIYNYLELREELEKAGFQFQSDTDTEVLLAAYCHWGKDCLQRFNGMWAFALYDAERQQIFCSRDRFGIKPFYYTQCGGQFCFASEIKQFTALPYWPRRLNTTRAWEFLVKGYHDHTPETFFEGVFQLPGGSTLIYDLQNHQYQIQSYYQLSEQLSPLNAIKKEEAVQEFYSRFQHAVKLRLRSDVPVGTALSGGLDSSSIVGMIHSLLDGQGQQRSISACFEGKAIDERPFIEAVVEQHKVKPTFVYPRFEQLFENFGQLIWQQDEPIAGAGVFAQQQVFQAARANGITVMLDGQGADEILCGYEKFYLPLLKQQWRQKPLAAMNNIYRFFQLHQIGPAEAIGAGWQFLNKVKKEEVNWLDVDQKMIRESLFRRAADQDLRSTSLNALAGVGLPILLHYEDRNSMAASVESRLPFLDYQLVEFCLSLPDHLKIQQGVRKYILREAMKPLLPQKVYHRYDKLGYATPQKQWMKKHQAVFQQYLKEAIAASQGLIRPVVADSEDADLQWRIIAFGQWMQQFDLSI